MTRVAAIAIVAVLGSAGLIACLSTEEGSPLPSSTGDATDARAAVQPAEIHDEDLIPCAPRAVLQNVCQRCHQDPPIRGAPFPLVTRSNIARSNIRERMIAQLSQRRMPARPETIDEASRSTLLEWLEDEAPALTVPVEACNANDGGVETSSSSK